MVNLKEKTILVWDFGAFSYVAERFAKDYGRVLYYCPYDESFPRYNKYVIGSGLENVQKIDSFWPYYNEIDVWYFSDLYQGKFQQWLKNNGRLVFGSGMGAEMELYRDGMKSLQKDLGLELNEYEVIQGFDNLREYLKNNEDKYVKSNLLRGSMETWHHENYKLSAPVLDELQHSFGIFKDDQTFIVETPIKNAIEYGYDGFCVNGQYPEKTMFGIEVKDSAYAAVFTDYEKLPPPIKDINDKLSDIFKNYDYTGWYSNEVRSFTKGKGTLTDMTCRNAEPPTSLAVEMLENYPMYVWDVANGVVPKVKSKFKYGAQIIMKSDWAREEPQAIYFPAQYKDYVKIKNLVIKDGIHYFVPQIGTQMEEIGAVIGMGSTLKQAIEQAKEIAKEVKGYSLKINGDALDEANEEIEKLSKIGIRLF